MLSTNPLQRRNNKGVEGSNAMPRSTKKGQKGWLYKRLRKKESDIGDKMLMNSSRCKVSQARKV